MRTDERFYELKVKKEWSLDVVERRIESPLVLEWRKKTLCYSLVYVGVSTLH